MKTIDRQITCDICCKNKASYDGKMRIGSWAYMCKYCFIIWGVGLGLGKGQKLYKDEK